ncbi:hypothetical protein AAAC51_16205 [Priestia megaterium]
MFARSLFGLKYLNYGKKAKKELWLFYTVLAIGMVVSICKALGLNVPNPSDLSAAIFKPISIFLLHLLS